MGNLELRTRHTSGGAISHDIYASRGSRRVPGEQTFRQLAKARADAKMRQLFPFSLSCLLRRRRCEDGDGMG
jgi:hypothetical protein